MDENTALNDTTNATIKDQEWKKKGFLPLVVILVVLLGLAFYAGQSRGARTTSLAGSGGTASLMMLSNEAVPCTQIPTKDDCVKAYDNNGIQCVASYSYYLRRDACMKITAVPTSVCPPLTDVTDCVNKRDMDTVECVWGREGCMRRTAKFIG